MDIFEEKEKEKKNKEIFIETSKKNVKIVRLILTIVYSVVGIGMLTGGLVLLFAVGQLEAGIVLSSIGGVFLLTVLILQVVLRNINYDNKYERYKKRIENGSPIYSTYDMSLRIVALEKRVKELEDEVDSLRRNK